MACKTDKDLHYKAEYCCVEFDMYMIETNHWLNLDHVY